VGRTIVLVDGENIDATLGTNVFARRPQPDERPRWERVTRYVTEQWGQPALGLFFLNVSGGTMPTQFVQALLAMHYRPVPLSGREDQKVVDIGILRTLGALLERDDDVVLVSHDGDFADALEALDDDEGERRVALVGFREFMSHRLNELDLPVFDLEDDVSAFNAPLPRVRAIDLADFDPAVFLR
jgi:putative heme uptake system protein